MNGVMAKMLRSTGYSLADRAKASEETVYEDKVINYKSYFNETDPDNPYVLPCITRRLGNCRRHWVQRVKRDHNRGLL